MEIVAEAGKAVEDDGAVLIQELGGFSDSKVSAQPGVGLERRRHKRDLRASMEFRQRCARLPTSEGCPCLRPSRLMSEERKGFVLFKDSTHVSSSPC